jgi:YD repeat-containing protein
MTWSRYGQLLTFTDCSGYRTRYEYNRFGQVTALHQEEGLSQYRAYDKRGRLISLKDAAGHETRYEYSVAGDLTTVIHPDGSRQTTTYDAAGHPASVTEGGLTRQRSMTRRVESPGWSMRTEPAPPLSTTCWTVSHNRQALTAGRSVISTALPDNCSAVRMKASSPSGTTTHLTV